MKTSITRSHLATLFLLAASTLASACTLDAQSTSASRELALANDGSESAVEGQAARPRAYAELPTRRRPAVSPERAVVGAGIASSNEEVLPVLIGEPCTEDAQCESNACADGVCCDTACDGTCESCNQPGQVGWCMPYAPDSDPENECGETFCNGKSQCGGESE